MRTRVGVLHVEDGVVVRALAEDLGVECQRRVGGIPRERVAQRIRPDPVAQIVELDDVARALGQARAVDRDELPDEHLDVLLGIVARRPRERLEAVHVAMVVGAEQVDLVREAPVALVEVVRGVGGEVRVLAVRAADHPVLVVAEVGRAHPHGALVVEDVTLRAQAVDRLVDEARPAACGLRVQRALREPHVEGHVEVGEGGLDLAELELVRQVARNR